MVEPASQRIRVAIDVTSLIGERTGVGHVTAAFVAHLAVRLDVALVAYAVTGNAALASTTRLPPGLPLRITGVPARALFASWRRSPQPRIDRWTGPVDVVHGTNFVVPPTRAATVVTVHDVAFLRDPHLVSAASRRYASLLRVAIARGATVQVFSDTVAEEVRTRCAVAADRVVRIYPGIAGSAAVSSPDGGGDRPPDAAAGHLPASAQRYMLALGTVEPRKNLPRLVQAFDRIADRDPDVHLVVAGPDGWGTDAFTTAVAIAAHRTRIIRLGYVEDQVRRDLIAAATVLVYPSLDEGFGHPPLEAMRAGVPVVAAHAGALPEVLGDAAVLVDPTDVEALANALATVLSDTRAADRLKTAGLARAERYSWDRATDELVQLYRRLARSR